MKISSVLLATLASMLAVSSHLKAMPLVFESFDYELGVMIPEQGGTVDGWGGAWETSGGTDAEFESVVVGLTFEGLEVLGGASQRTARFGMQSMSRTISPAAQSSLTADDSTIWFSVLMQATAPTDPVGGGGFATNSYATLIFGSDSLNGGNGAAAAPISETGSAFGVSFADTSDNTGVFENMQIQGVSYNSGVLTQGLENRVLVGTEPALVVGSMTWAANGSDDILNLYLITDLAAALPEPFVTMIDDFDQSTFNVVSIGDSQTSVFDEIRFGLSLGDVVGGLGESVAPEITSIAYDATSDPGNILVTITFNSELGKTYTAYVTSDLEISVFDRTDADDGIVGEEGSTIFVINFDDLALDKDVTKFFVVISENL